MLQGCMDPKANPYHFEFRDKSMNANFYVRRYMQDKERAEMSEKIHQSLFLDIGREHQKIDHDRPQKFRKRMSVEDQRRSRL